MSYQSGDILISEIDGFVNDIYVIVEEEKMQNINHILFILESKIII